MKLLGRAGRPVRKARAVIAVVALAAAMAAAAGPRLSFVGDRNSVEMGVMLRDTFCTRPLRIVNTGDSALVITSVFSDCRCSYAKFPREAIAPGDTAVIEVFFNSARRHPGAFVKSMRIRSNDKCSPHSFVITGTVDRYSTKD